MAFCEVRAGRGSVNFPRNLPWCQAYVNEVWLSRREFTLVRDLATTGHYLAVLDFAGQACGVMKPW